MRNMYMSTGGGLLGWEKPVFRRGEVALKPVFGQPRDRKRESPWIHARLVKKRRFNVENDGTGFWHTCGPKTGK